MASSPTNISMKFQIIFDEEIAPINIDIRVNAFNNFNDLLGLSTKYFKDDSPL